MLNGSGGYVTGSRCWVGTYGQLTNKKGPLKCRPGHEAHHIVPDTMNRTGNRKQGMKKDDPSRIIDTPSFHDGPAICLKGRAKMEGSEHHIAHKCDKHIQAAGRRTDNGPLGTIPVAEALELIINSFRALRPQCVEEIRAELEKAYYQDVNKDCSKDDRFLNATGHPPSAEVRKHLRDGRSVDGKDSIAPTRSAGRKKQ